MTEVWIKDSGKKDMAHLLVESDSHLHLDPGLMGVVDKFKVRECEIVDFRLFWIEFKNREWMRIALKLGLQWLDVVQIDMGITECMDEFTALKTTNLGKHACEQSITRDIEWNSESKIA